MVEEDFSFEDSEDWRGVPHGSITYEQIVLNQINKCVSEGSKEIRGGFYEQKRTSKGIIELYIPNQHEVYIRSVDCLNDLLLAYFDDEMEKASEELMKELAKRKEDKINKLKMSLENTRDARVKANIKSQIDTRYLDKDSFLAEEMKKEEYELSRELFRELLLLFNRKRHLMAEAIME